MVAIKLKGPIVNHPLGPSNIYTCGGWLIPEGFTTTDDSICEFCGTLNTIEESQSGYLSISKVLGLVIVEQCCGTILDQLYEELSQEFTIELLSNFVMNNENKDHHQLIIALEDTLKVLKEFLKIES